MEGAELELFERLVVASERSAKANEDLIRLATDERDIRENMPLIPNCPHCGYPDPVVRGAGGTGPMSEFKMAGICQSCRGMVIAVPVEGMVLFTSEEAVEEYLEGKGGQ